MARFYLHIRSGDHVETDPEGADFPDLTAARNEALASARDILADAIKARKTDVIDSIVIADESGHELDTVALKDILPKNIC